MAVISKTLLAVLPAFISLINGAAVPSVVARDDDDPNLACFKNVPDRYDNGQAILMNENFCAANMGTSIAQYTSVTTKYDISATPMGSHIHVEVNNIQCPGGMVIDSNCQVNLQKVNRGCASASDDNEASGGSYFANGCGYYMITIINADDKRSIGGSDFNNSITPIESGKRDVNMACVSSSSTCNPPHWETCTGYEQTCLVDMAADPMGCLKVGRCSG